MTRIEKIQKELSLNCKIELIGNELGIFELYEYANDKGNSERVIYVTDSDFKKANNYAKQQLQFYKQIAPNIYKV